MSVKIVCDVCGKHETPVYDDTGNVIYKPNGWFHRRKQHQGILWVVEHACSDKCREILAKQ